MAASFFPIIAYNRFFSPTNEHISRMVWIRRRKKTKRHGFMYHSPYEGFLSSSNDTVWHGDTPETPSHRNKPVTMDNSNSNNKKRNNDHIISHPRLVPLLTTFPIFPEHQPISITLIIRMKRPKSHLINSAPGHNRLKPRHWTKVDALSLIASGVRSDVYNLPNWFWIIWMVFCTRMINK